MTASLSNSKLRDEATPARGGNSAVLYAALAVLVAIALHLVMSAGSNPIAQDAAAIVVGP
jgi:hypothetical protein